MLITKIVLFAFTIVFDCCYCQKFSTYRAAVAEIHPDSNVKKQIIDIINSPDVKDVDIIVFPEAILNNNNPEILLPNSTVFCDDQNAHPIFRDISCAARTAKMYVVIDLYTKVYCSVDDQTFCANKTDSTNKYNTAFVFDRSGATIAKYRKYNSFGEKIQKPEKPDLVTFQTDFNVTFGVFICFDLQFYSPPIQLVDKGIRNFVYPTYWAMELPFVTAAQYQQSWAYANNVNLLAANGNARSYSQCSGSGIYAGRLKTLDVFASTNLTTKVLIANVPIDLPTFRIENDVEEFEIGQGTTAIEKSPIEVNNNINKTYDPQVYQENVGWFAIEFLDFTKRLSYNGTICHHDLCCYYDIDVNDNGSQDGKPSYFYAVTAYNNHYGYGWNSNLFTYRSTCGLIACGEMNNRSSCGKRFATDVHYRYNFKKLSFKMIPPTNRAKNIMPNTITNDLYPLNANEFELKISKLRSGPNYVATLTLTVPKSDLLTFAIFSRDYQKDKLNNGTTLKSNYYLYIIFTVSLCMCYW